MIIVNVMTLNLYMFLRVATLSQPPGWINDDDNVNDDSLRGESFLSTDETDDTVGASGMLLNLHADYTNFTEARIK